VEQWRRTSENVGAQAIIADTLYLHFKNVMGWPCGEKEQDKS